MSSKNGRWRNSQCLRRSAACCLRHGRRGVAALVVLLLISVTLALSYAMVRSQGTAVLLADNTLLAAQARQAALSGMAIAMMTLHSSNRWSGADTTLVQDLSSSERFEVRFETGDASLGAGSPEYGDWPYRLTVVSTGFARDPTHSAREISHQVRSTVRLVPRQLAPEPANWQSDVLNYTLYQWAPGTVSIDPPARVEGRVRLQSRLHLGCNCAWSDAARATYLIDLNAMRSKTPAATGLKWLQLDYRPFSNGPIWLPHSWQEYGLVRLLDDIWNPFAADMDVSTVDSESVTRSLASAYSTDRYQIYAGGRTYSAVAVGYSHTGVSFQPAPESNPLGVFYRGGDIELRDNVTIRGSLMAWSDSSADVVMSGRGVNVESFDLPGLVGGDGRADSAVRLPTVVSTGDITIGTDSQTSVRGMLAAVDRFEVASDAQADTELMLEGKVVAREFVILKRSEWDRSSTWWGARWAEYNALSFWQRSVTPFPVWLAAYYGLDYRPRLIIKEDSQPGRYFWPTTNGPVYVPHAADDGLRWDLVSWTINQE